MLEFDLFTIIQSLFWSVFVGVILHYQAVRLRGRGPYDLRPWKTLGYIGVIATLVFVLNAAVNPSCVGKLKGGAEGGADPTRTQQGRGLSASAPEFIPGQPFQPPGGARPDLQQQGAAPLRLGQGATGQVVYRYGTERQFQFIMAPPGVRHPTRSVYPFGRGGPVHYHPNVPVELPELDQEQTDTEDWKFAVFTQDGEHRWTIAQIIDEYEKQESRREQYLIKIFGELKTHSIHDIIAWKYTSDKRVAETYVEDFNRKPLPLSESVDFFTRLAAHGQRTVIGCDMLQGDAWTHVDWPLEHLHRFIDQHPSVEIYVDGPYRSGARASKDMVYYWSQLVRGFWTLSILNRVGGVRKFIPLRDVGQHYDELILKMELPNGEMKPPSMEYLKQLEAEERTALGDFSPMEVRFPDGKLHRVTRQTIEKLREQRPQIQHGFILAFTYIPGYCYIFSDERYNDADCLPQMFSHTAQWVIDGLWPFQAAPVTDRRFISLEGVEAWLAKKTDVTPMLNALKDDWIKVTPIPLQSRPAFEFWHHAYTFPDIMQMNMPKNYFSAVLDFVQRSQFLESIAPQLSGKMLKDQLIETVNAFHPHRFLLFCRVPTDAALDANKTRLLSGIGLCYNARNQPRDCRTTDEKNTCRGAQYIYILPPENQKEPLPFPT